MKKKPAASSAASETELTELRARLQEAEDTIDAIRNGQVEAIVVNTADGPKVFAIEGADHRYRRLVETMNEGALLVSRSGVILYSNRAFATMMRCPLDSIIGRSFCDFVQSSFRASFQALLDAGASHPVADEVLLRGHVGASVPTYLSLTPNQDGEVGICVIVTNLTAQKRNEEILASELLSTSILEQAAEAILVCDLHGVVTRASRAARAIAPGKVVHRHVDDAFPLQAIEAQCPMSHPATRALAGEVVTGLEMTLVVADGTSVPVLCTAAPLLNERKEVLGCVMSVIDITPRKRVESERQALLDAERAARSAAERARADAEASNRSKDEFLATVSHELRTPLNAIVGWSSLMAEGGVSADRHAHAIEVIRRNADAQARLIEDLLDVSRIISGQMRLEVKAVEPGRVVQAVIDSVRPALDAKEIRLETILDSEVSTIMGDEARVQQIVWNLVSNASKFTPRHGRIRIVLRRVDSAIEILVEDNGQGIHQDFLPYVFDRFRQADGAISRKHGGLGLGLAITRHLVELHGGKISVTSDGQGKGSAFTVRLPRAVLRDTPVPTPPSPPQSGFPQRARQEVDLSHVSVLVVEDDPDSRDLLLSILEECGAQASGVSSAQEALERLAVETPNVLVSDIGMPEMDGYAFIRRVRSLTDQAQRVPALALTAYARAEDRRRALSEGFQMHLAKPVDPSEFAISIGALAKYETR